MFFSGVLLFLLLLWLGLTASDSLTHSPFPPPLSHHFSPSSSLPAFSRSPSHSGRSRGLLLLLQQRPGGWQVTSDTQKRKNPESAPRTRRLLTRPSTFLVLLLLLSRSASFCRGCCWPSTPAGPGARVGRQVASQGEFEGQDTSCSTHTTGIWRLCDTRRSSRCGLLLWLCWARWVRVGGRTDGRVIWPRASPNVRSKARERKSGEKRPWGNYRHRDWSRTENLSDLLVKDGQLQSSYGLICLTLSLSQNCLAFTLNLGVWRK